jgi:N-acetylmuramoyl-L-alanine amidase
LGLRRHGRVGLRRAACLQRRGLGAQLGTNKASPQAPGTTILLTGSATCGGTPEYRFWVGHNGGWTIVKDFSASNTFSWNTTGKLQGTYGLEVDVRNQGSTTPYETVANLTFSVT